MQTDHLLLRPYTAEDFEDYYSYIMDPELQYMLGLHDVTDRSTALLTFEWLMANREFYALIDKCSMKAIGHICIHPGSLSPDRLPEYQEKRGCSLSFAIAKSHRRMGLMEEALRQMIAWLFQECVYDYIDCEYTSFNAASQALQEKLGFRKRLNQVVEDFILTTCVMDNPFK